VAIKAGQILHVGNDSVVIDRIQTAGPGNLSIPTEKIYELGNYKSVATIRDVPDLSFTMESLDVTTEIEAMLLAVDPSTNELDLSLVKPLDIGSLFKAGKDAASPFAVVESVGIPFLVCDSIGYRFGLRDNARQTVGLRGDSIYYNPGATYIDQAVGTGAAGQTLATSQPAYSYAGDGTPRRILSVTADNKRLVAGSDYTEAAGAEANGAATVTVTFVKAVRTGAAIRVMYASPTVREYAQTVHPDVLVKPAAVRGKDIDVYVGGYDPADVAGSAVNRWTSVQAVSADWRVTLEKDEEFGNYAAVSNEFDVPAVSGSIDLKPRDPQELLTKIRQIAGVSVATEVVGPNSSVTLPVDIVIKNAADDGATLKRLHIPDARFTLPGYSGRANTRLTMTMNFESDEGTLKVFKA
jgi:hypothetical protein